MADTAFSIDNDVLKCSKCNSEHPLTKSGESYDHCDCYNIRLIRCKTEMHITLLDENKEFWYEYTTIKTK